ncbi:MAG: iron-sulfur cluster assembly scaffold protein [Parvibaculum sp.]|jgi:NifU-like protein involved in Fe-S cluster formation|uniref:iron-sulfur cluster assembly scaffold protein n=1 Tax=Parvibaculum sp. TaxID=2024848 RepID=UPI0028488732|nr:iron-sulfur cluster assembly scaffold protein [Parvibaculum sp.]MDR3499263.1 iron-sulfur cluster assembly scaffold protein [Parvibaculum sp.]
MLNEIYNTRILKLAADIPLTERLAAPDASATAVSKMCGSKVTVDVRMEGDRVVGYGAEVKACALGQASSSIMARHVIGATADELHQIGAAMRRMLKEGGEPPRELFGGKWADLEVLEPVRDYKARHASTLLVFDAVEEAVDEALSRQGSGTQAAPRTATSTGPA